MKLSKLAHSLYEEISELTIVDSHEHLPSEEEYLSYNYSGPNMFAGYVWHDLESAGMPIEFKNTLRVGGDRPVEAWWRQVKPYWEQVSHTSFARALRITAYDLFGIKQFNDTTIYDFAERIKEDNTPGLYRRILQERCRIRVSITCVQQVDFPQNSSMRGLSQHVIETLNKPLSVVKAEAQENGIEIHSLEDVAAAIQGHLREDVSRNAVGFKIYVGEYGVPNYKEAAAEFGQAREADKAISAFPALRDYLFDKFLDVAAETGVPVAVHTGYWGDFRQLDPKFMLGFAARRQDVQFDLFHLGMPMIRDAIHICKAYPNIVLNLTWCPIISQIQTRRALDEILDLVPVNKIIAFGGDYRVSVQKVWGHLVMARECVAAALADRIEAGDLDRAEALRIAKLWFCDNPTRVYRLA
jgi:predicted TIM-barrel fold metal-dependent hydrolase